jgi:hypothetical protein
MNYANFDNTITVRFGLVIRNWPLNVFAAPGDIRTVTELRVLHSAWTSGIAHFYRLTKEEFALWRTSNSYSAIPDSTSSSPSDPMPPLAPPVEFEELNNTGQDGSDLGNCTGNPRVSRGLPVPIPAHTHTRGPAG